MTLIELMVVIGIAVITTVGTVTFSMVQHPGVTGATRWAINAAMGEGVALAEASGNGATLVFEPGGAQNPNGTPSSLQQIRVYDGRPNGKIGYAMPPLPTKALQLPDRIEAGGQNGVSAANGFSIFIDGFGRATYGSWVEPDGTITIPTCTVDGVPLTITIGTGTNAQTMKLPCGGENFQSFYSSGTAIPDAIP